MDVINTADALDNMPRLNAQQVSDLVDDIAGKTLTLHPEDAMTVIAGVVSIPIATESFDDADFARMRQFVCTQLIGHIIHISEDFYKRKMSHVITMPETVQ